LTEQGDSDACQRQVIRAVRPGWHVIVAAFDSAGTEMCCGLPVMRHGARELHYQIRIEGLYWLAGDTASSIEMNSIMSWKCFWQRSYFIQSPSVPKIFIKPKANQDFAYKF